MANRTRRPQLERDTTLVAGTAAQAVIEEAVQSLGRPLPARYATALAARAGQAYTHSAQFRRKVGEAGDRGRDWLHVFLRHWLAALLHDERPHLFARLPSSFANGEALPPPEDPAPGFGSTDDEEPYLSNEARQLIA